MIHIKEKYVRFAVIISFIVISFLIFNCSGSTSMKSNTEKLK